MEYLGLKIFQLIKMIILVFLINNNLIGEIGIKYLGSGLSKLIKIDNLILDLRFNDLKILY